MNIRWFVVHKLFIGLFILLSSCVYYGESIYCPSTIINKDYDAPYTSILYTGKTYQTIYHPEDYDINLNTIYKSISINTWVDCDEYQYNSVNIGDKVSSYVRVLYNKNGELLTNRMYIELYYRENYTNKLLLKFRN
jgi:hypothetical protein